MSFWMEKRRVAWLSVASNALLTAGKLVAGFVTGSVSILSEAAHSAIDLIAAALRPFPFMRPIVLPITPTPTAMRK